MTDPVNVRDDGEEPSVMGAGCGPSRMPTHDDAIAAWRRLFAARLVECGVLDQEGATACAEAADVDLSIAPAAAADDEVSYWSADE